MALIKITDTSIEPLTVDQAIRHLRLDYVDADLRNELAALITVARTTAEDRLQASLLPTTWRLTLERFPALSRVSGPQVRLPMGPVISITSLTYRDPLGVPTPMQGTAWRLEADLLMPVFGATWPSTAVEPGAVRIDYQAGYASAAAVPAPVVQWIKMALADLYLQRARSAERPAVPQNFVDGLLDVYKNPVV